MKRFGWLLAVAACLAVSGALTAEIDWKTDYNEAKQQARKEDKPMLLMFTGSDWCAWCKKLEREVFHSGQFEENAGEDYIFVMLDFPRNSYQPRGEREQNQELSNRFNIRGFPTVILLDRNEQEIARTGYQAGGPTAYAEHLQQLVAENTNGNHSRNYR